MTADEDSVPGMERLMTVELVRLDGAAVVRVTGEVDELTVARMATALETAFAVGPGPVIVDLREVTVLAASGLEALVQAQRTASRQREPLRIVVDRQRPVIRPLEITGLDEVLSLYYDVEEALRSRAADDQDVG